jgi:malate/lactate dehydrogenase
MNQLEVLKSELLDCCFQKVKSINNYSQNQQAAALSQADLVIFLGAALRKPGMDLHEVFEQNAVIFK